MSQQPRLGLQRKDRVPLLGAASKITVVGRLALTGFEPWVSFVDNINPAFTAHNAAIAVARLERTEGVANFHVFCPLSRGAAIAPLLLSCATFAAR